MMGISSSGRAAPLQGVGDRFEPGIPNQVDNSGKTKYYRK